MYSSIVADGDNILNSQYNNLRKDAFQVGSILMYGGSIYTPPAGWLICDGTSIDTTTYADLFALIGYTFGGAGASFNLPDMRTRFPIGVKSGTYNLADTGGSNTIILTTAEIPEHTHTISTIGTEHTHDVLTYTSGVSPYTRAIYTTQGNFTNYLQMSSTTQHNHGGATGNTGESSPTTLDITPAYQYANFIICYGLTADVAQYDQLLDSQFNNVRNEMGIYGIIALFTNSSIPSNWLLCDGSAISRTTYADLFGIIGERFGIGDGSTTFNLPNLTERFIRAANIETDIGNTGSGNKTLIATNVPQHNHSISIEYNHPHSMPNGWYGGGSTGVGILGSSTGNNPEDTIYMEAAGAHDHGGSTGSAGSATSFIVLPKYLALAYMIRY